MSESAIRAPRLDVLGVRIVAIDENEALRLVEDVLAAGFSRPCQVFFVNAHTLKLASEDSHYRSVLEAADCVFGDGTGVRWAVRHLYGAELANVNGTDLVPKLLGSPAVSGRRYFLLGATGEAIPNAAEEVRRRFPAWQLAGYHHGYVPVEGCDDVVARINASGAELLLVGMGNPKQEIWIHENARRLEVKVCMGVGGLFDYWAGNLDRAPVWIRRAGIEWLHLMLRQPHKTARYLIGGPLFMLRVARDRRRGAHSR